MHSCYEVKFEIISDSGFSDNLPRMLPQTVQRVLFSATFPSRVTNYAEKFAPRANQITLEHQELTVEGIRQFYFDCKDEDVKYEVLLQLYGLMTVGSSIIFVKVKPFFFFERLKIF